MKSKFALFLWLIIGISPLSTQTYLDSISISVQNQSDSIKAERFIQAFRYLMYRNIEQAKLATDSSYIYATQSKVDKLIGRSIQNQGSYFYLQNRLDTALSIYNKAYDYYFSHGDLANSAGTLINIGNCLGDKGDLVGSQKAHFKSLRIQDSLGISGMAKATNLLNIGVLYSEMNEFAQSNSYYRKARKIYEELDDEQSMAEVDFNIAINLFDLDSVQTSQTILDRLEKYHRKNDHIYNLMNVLMESGKNFYVNGEYKKSEDMLLDALSLAQEYRDESSYGFLYNKLMELYLKQNDFVKGEKYALLSYEYTKQKGNLLELVHDYNNLSTLYYNKGEYEKAYAYHVKYHKLQDSLFSVQKIREIEELKTKYETEKKDIEIKTLSQEVKINKLRKGIYGLGLIGSLICLVLGYFWFRQRAKNEKIKRDAKELELENALKFKRKELASQTLHLVQKNTFIQNLTQELQHTKIDEDTYKKEVQKVLTSLKLEPELDKDWDLFKSYFSEVHNDFDHRIKDKCPGINENEMRLAYLLRMQLNSNEIAAVMRVLPESVRKSKYRFKKKLGLGKDQDLTNFLLTM